jgi:2-keto-4-pentenoate hydratase/2-oxohepta-3-ene-1,7-dioic acid hydratase in catechol pathway
MRIVRYASPDAAGGRGAAARLGRVRGDEVEPLRPGDGSAELADLIEQGAFGRPAPVASDSRPEPLAGVRLLAPLAAPGKVVAIGLNYVDHVAESKATAPTEPLVFAKFPSSIVGPGEPITWDPGLTDGVDFEAELGVVIGRPARRVSAERALEHVFAYTCLNDVSARDLQLRDGQWVRGKSLDSFCPIGPWLVTADEIPDPQSLAISCDVSGERLQSASTADMIFGVAELIARLSHSFTLEAGDLIATGTPPGVGWFREPRRVLRDGDEVVVSVERVGSLSNPVRVG